MKVHLFKIECLTNLHVGSGDVNYSIIDNEVQRDPVLQDVPIIPGSGVKGAMREYFEGAGSSLTPNDVKKIFGADDKGNGTGQPRITTPGSYKFFDAFCLARPLRVAASGGYTNTYVLGIGLDGLKSYLRFLDGLGFSLPTGDIDFEGRVFLTHGMRGTIFIEGESASNSSLQDDTVAEALKELQVGSQYAVASSLSNYPLPVAARNQLENGTSKNLWYEEFVPHKSLFYTVIIAPDESFGLDFDGQVVQFGGNATVGYGYTNVTEVSSWEA